MNALLEIFRGSFVLKIAIGIITFLSSEVITINSDINYTYDFDNIVDIELQKKFTEMTNLYFSINDQITFK